MSPREKLLHWLDSESDRQLEFLIGSQRSAALIGHLATRGRAAIWARPADVTAADGLRDNGIELAPDEAAKFLERQPIDVTLARHVVLLVCPLGQKGIA